MSPATWPSIEEITQHKRQKLPPDLLEELTRRYREHGGEYASEEVRDGKPINLAWFKDNLVDVREELVDAIFNALIYNLRSPEQQHGNYLIDGLLYVWRMLQDEEKAQAMRADSEQAALG
jgi:hypothetical protein